MTERIKSNVVYNVNNIVRGPASMAPQKSRALLESGEISNIKRESESREAQVGI